MSENDSGEAGTGTARRFFSAPSLARALAEAARHYGLAPDEVDYRVRDKRHGFVRAPRGVVIEVDPAAPRRAPGSAPRAASGGEARTAGDRPERPERSEARERVERGPRPARPERRGGVDRTERSRSGAGEAEPWAAPDAESELAASEASARLLRLAGLALEARVRRGEDRLEIELVGADAESVAPLDDELLDRLEHLLPRAIHGLCGRLVRVRVDAAGRRDAREAELRARARAAAAEVLSGDVPEVVLEPMAPAERRIVHLELGDLAGVTTESLGQGHRKRVRISRDL
jgi:spoIIIJ-associated protein